MRMTTIIDISINFYNDFYNDEIPVETCVTNQMLNDVPSSMNPILNFLTLTSVNNSNQD